MANRLTVILACAPHRKQDRCKNSLPLRRTWVSSIPCRKGRPIVTARRKGQNVKAIPPASQAPPGTELRGLLLQATLQHVVDFDRRGDAPAGLGQAHQAIAIDD